MDLPLQYITARYNNCKCCFCVLIGHYLRELQMRIAIIAASAALLSVSAAHAGGLYDKGSMKDTPSYVETATPVWGGLYIGGSAGFGTGDTSGKVKNRKHGPQTDYDVNGAIYGLHAGYNWQRGNLVYGLEAGFNGTNMDGSTSCSWNSTCERELDWYGTGVARIGYAPGNTLFCFGECIVNVFRFIGQCASDAVDALQC
ncbi:MAG: hypothetical protein P8Y36_14570, partial [Alphaproteobacteria bacterium]